MLEGSAQAGVQRERLRYLDVLACQAAQSVPQHFLTLLQGQQPICHPPKHLPTQLGSCGKLVLRDHALQQSPAHIIMSHDV